MDLKKEIDLNKKILIVLIMLCVLTIGMYSSYALFEKKETYDNVVKIQTADEIPKEDKRASTVIKKTLNQEGGVVGVTNDNKPVFSDNGNIREYRYAGLNVNNYVYFNCKDNLPQNSDNCEIWRIVGVFKDENGEEKVKIVQNETLTNIPATYTANDIAYNLAPSGSVVYWDNKSSTYSNNWETSGLKAWLNAESTDKTGFLTQLSGSSQAMIASTKYYLGSLTYDNTYYIKDNSGEAYKYERAVSGCEKNKGPSTNNNQSAVEGNETCRVWADKVATWTGKIGLLYPSDVGFSIDSQYWNKVVLGYGAFDGAVANSSWLQIDANHSNHEWLLSPVAYTLSDDVSRWSKTGYLYNNHANYNGNRARATLYLSSDVLINDGDGTSDTPYQLAEQEPYLSLSENSGTVMLNNQITFTASSNITGTFSLTVDNGSIVSAAITTSHGKETTITITGNNYGTTNINVKLKPDDSNYTELNKTYKISVGVNAVVLLKTTLNKEKGIIGLNPTTGETCTSNCPEYRYSGANVNNYVQLTNYGQQELWRIIGIFKENNEEYLRLVRNEALPKERLPLNYVVNEITYTIRNVKKDNEVYWNKNDSGKQNNDWKIAGLQYYLNTEYDELRSNKGYMSYLSEEIKSMLGERTHYLGAFIRDTDTPVLSYQHERDVESCVGNKGATTEDNFPTTGCNVWDGNDATWKGSISLMYPSDVGYTVDEQYWSTTKIFNSDGARDTSWIYKTMPDAQSKDLWTLSPSSIASFYASCYYSSGLISVLEVYGNYYAFKDVDFTATLHPVLNLKSQVKITSGEGTKDNPYILWA